MSNEGIIIILLMIIGVYCLRKVILHSIDAYYDLSYKVVEHNPKELTEYLYNHFYGFKGVQILLVQPKHRLVNTPNILKGKQPGEWLLLLPEPEELSFLPNHLLVSAKQTTG